MAFTRAFDVAGAQQQQQQQQQPIDNVAGGDRRGMSTSLWAQVRVSTLESNKACMNIN